MGAVPDVVIRYDLLHTISNAVILFTVTFYKCGFFFARPFHLSKSCPSFYCVHIASAKAFSKFRTILIKYIYFLMTGPH